MVSECQTHEKYWLVGHIELGIITNGTSIIQGAGIAHSVEALYFTTELHTSSVRVRVQPGTKYLYGKKSVGICGLAAMVSQAYPGNAEICPGFPPPQTALHIILSNEGDAVYVDR